jgi:L-lactate dehydrogenase complex protein LldF
MIKLDNGRTKVVADKVGRAALHCIRCSACLNVAARVYTRTGGHANGLVYPRPIGAILTLMLTGHNDPARPCRTHRRRAGASRYRRVPGSRQWKS